MKLEHVYHYTWTYLNAIVARNVTAAKNTHAITEELLDTFLCGSGVSQKASNYFCQNLFIAGKI
jgi:hypothetical protein